MNRKRFLLLIVLFVGIILAGVLVYLINKPEDEKDEDKDDNGSKKVNDGSGRVILPDLDTEVPSSDLIKINHTNSLPSTMEGVVIPITFESYKSGQFPTINISVNGKASEPYLLDTGSAILTTHEVFPGGINVIVQHQGQDESSLDVPGFVQEPTKIAFENGISSARVVSVPESVPLTFGLATYGLLQMGSNETLTFTHQINNLVPPIFSLLPQGKRILRFNFLARGLARGPELSFGVGKITQYSAPLVGRFRFFIPCKSSIDIGPCYVMLDTGVRSYIQDKSGPSLEGSTLEFAGLPPISFGPASSTLDLDKYKKASGLDRNFVIIGIEYLKNFDFTIDLDNSKVYF